MDLFSAVYSSFCMGIIKIYFFFYLSYWLRLLLIVCGDVKSNPGPGSDKRVRVLYSRIMMFWFVLSPKSLIGAISRSSKSLALVAPNKVGRTLLLVPGYGLLC